MPGGVQAEKANIGGSATKQEGAKGGNVQAGGSTKKQDGPQGSAVQGDGSSKNPDGAQTTGVTKAHRDNLPAPTCAQIASRVRLGVIPRGYPETELSPDQQEAVKKVLLRKVLSQRREPFKPKFVFCKAKTGHILLSCQDKATADWVRTTVQQITPWRGAELEALDEANMPRQEVLLGFFYRSKNDDNETILGFLESQNDDMDTTMWKILQRTVRNDHVEWAFTVDMASMKLLEARSFVVNFKFGQTLIRKGRSDNVGAQEVAGLNPIDRMEVDSDVDDHEFGEPGPSMIATSQTIGSCAKGGDPSQGKAKQFPVDQTAIENFGTLTFLEQDIASERSNRHPLAADISDGGPSFVSRIPAAQKSDEGKTAVQYQAGHHAKSPTLQEQNIASERSNRHPLAADISDGGLSFVNRITNQIPAAQNSDAGKTAIQYQVTPARQISENEILQKNILPVVSIRHPLAQINNGGPKFIEGRSTNQFPTRQTSEEGKTSKRYQVDPAGASEGSDCHSLAADISNGGLLFVSRITNQILAAQTSDEGKTAKQYQVVPAGHTTDNSNLLDQDIALDRHPLAADISDGGPSFVSRIPAAQKSDEGKTALQYQAGHHAKSPTLQEQNIASERSNRHPLAADISDGGLSFVNRITNQIPAAQNSDAGKTAIQYQVTPARQISENEILQKNILPVGSIRHPLAQINNGGPKFIEGRSTNQFPTTQTSDEGKTSKRYQVAPVGASGGSDRHTLATDISDGGLSFVSRITNQIPAAQTSDECKTAKQYQVDPADHTTENSTLQEHDCFSEEYRSQAGITIEELQIVPYREGNQYEVVQSPAGDRTVFLIHNQDATASHGDTENLIFQNRDDLSKVSNNIPLLDITAGGSNLAGSPPAPIGSAVSSSGVRTIFSPNVLLNLLNSTITGSAIIESAALGELSESNQHELARIIAERHVQSKSKTTSDDLKEYATAVTALFKQEKEVNYYIPRGGTRKNFGGKIANKINGVKRKFKAKASEEENHRAKIKRVAEGVKETESSESDAATQWLILNQSPWNIVLEKWPKSLNARKPLLNERKLSQLLSSFPHYREESGFQLIDCDFENLFPAGANGFEKLKTLALQLKPYIEEKASDPSAERLISLLSHTSEDVQVLALFLALNTVLPPIAAAARYKPTIIVGQEDTVLFEESVDNIEARLSAVFDGYRERNLPIVPKLVCLGSSAVYNIPLEEQYDRVNKIVQFYKSS
ncbi:hypothetical protein pipiens_002065 [Culex pipiens pipiens]|uniref:DUF4780 domain-containing protein n=1 Tax=Culex pipiens pipiens TaxID=38569 RepID=A0ABD1DLQ5_CULPP